MLDFKKCTIELKPKIDYYYYKYGESSCQHSFASSFCLVNKYNDKFYEESNILYVNRSGLDDANYKYYLFPMCDVNEIETIKKALDSIIEDAHSFNKKVKFATITKNSKNILKKIYAGKFEIIDSRDNYEYLYDVNKIYELSGSHFQSKRNKIHKLEKEYGKSLKISIIEKKDQKKLEEFYRKCIDNYKDVNIFKNEIDEFNIAIDNYEKLSLVGIKILIDDKIVGFNFGSIINDCTYDGMIQKGDLNIEGIFELLNRETAKLIKGKVKFMNFEEDLGIEGLRKSKLLYQPDLLLEKFFATEV